MAAHASTDQQSCSSWITDFALTNHTLMDAILGFLAFHVRRSAPDDSSNTLAAISEASDALPGPGSGTFGFLLDFLDEAETSLEMLEAYRIAVSSLGKIYAAPLLRDLLRSPVRVSPRLVEPVEAQDPRTLAIVGRFFMPLKRRATYLWWAQGAAEKEFTGVISILPRD
ncbi:hypothetical protein CORC01_00282 [Colletotrichum orchidophilum]|uniref:Uncharacterized protein n=1 Tax=Colletotrichum orchidophilum TaxID=1209926 RepID=A0A1G4BSP7_9PEZI|nr:uncharacterized protein CORC01_00282 [Colletotrichum orchidophilum]OHF04430.1 hypothetical protein CORC01_00282 [Colletotrichum orchidophilum]